MKALLRVEYFSPGNKWKKTAHVEIEEDASVLDLLAKCPFLTTPDLARQSAARDFELTVTVVKLPL